MELDKIKSYLFGVSPKLKIDANKVSSNFRAYCVCVKIVFDEVDKSGWKLSEAYKDPYTSLICAIIGQKIAFTKARLLRSKLYFQLGSVLTPGSVLQANLSFLDEKTQDIIIKVTNHIVDNNIELDINGIKSLKSVPGIGQWTIDTTLLTCFLDWNIYPMGDTFLKNRLNRLYGKKLTVKEIAQIVDKWSPYKTVATWYLWRWF